MSATTQVWEDGVATVGRNSQVPSFEVFIADAQLRLRRALVARYGVEVGVEACADAMAWAWAHRDRLEVMANPVGYLFRVGQSAVRSHHRRLRAPPLPATPASAEIALPDPELQAALARIDEDQRAAVLLVHAHGYRYAEAAELLDIPVSTLRNRVRRGVTKMRRILESGR